jgi:hypothetical protein
MLLGSLRTCRVDSVSPATLSAAEPVTIFFNFSSHIVCSFGW